MGAGADPPSRPHAKPASDRPQPDATRRGRAHLPLQLSTAARPALALPLTGWASPCAARTDHRGACSSGRAVSRAEELARRRRSARARLPRPVELRWATRMNGDRIASPSALTLSHRARAGGNGDLSATSVDRFLPGWVDRVLADCAGLRGGRHARPSRGQLGGNEHFGACRPSIALGGRRRTSLHDHRSVGAGRRGAASAES